MPKKKTIEAPPPPALKTFAIPGYVMPLIAEWLQVSLSSAYAFIKAGRVPSGLVVARLANAPYHIDPVTWKRPEALKAELIYTRWYEAVQAVQAVQEEQEQDQEEPNIQAQDLQENQELARLLS